MTNLVEASPKSIIETLRLGDRPTGKLVHEDCTLSDLMVPRENGGDRKMYIMHSEFRGSLNIGNFLVDKIYLEQLKIAGDLCLEGLTVGEISLLRTTIQGKFEILNCQVGGKFIGHLELDADKLVKLTQSENTMELLEELAA